MLSTWTFDTDDFVVQKVSHDVGEFHLQELNDKETQLTLELSKIQQHKKKLHKHMHPMNPLLKYENTEILLQIFSFLPTHALVAFSMCSRMTHRMVKENWEHRTRNKYQAICPKHCDNKPWDKIYRTIEQNEAIAANLANLVQCPWCDTRQQILINPEGKLTCAACHMVLSTICISLPLKKIKSLSKSHHPKSNLKKRKRLPKVSTASSPSRKGKTRPTTPSTSSRKSFVSSKRSTTRPQTASLRSRSEHHLVHSLGSLSQTNDDDERLLYAKELVQWRDHREHKKLFRADKPNHWYCYGCAQSNNHFSPEGYYCTKIYTISNYHVDGKFHGKPIPVLDCRYGVMCDACVRHRSMRLGLSGFIQ